MAPQIDPNINPLIWTAIEQKRLLRFRHKNRERIVEPHDYGIHNGVIKLFGYQVAGSSSRKLPTWRWAEQDLMSDIHMLDRPFLVAAQPSRVSTINGTSCSSESNRPIQNRNRALQSCGGLPTQPCRLTGQFFLTFAPSRCFEVPDPHPAVAGRDVAGGDRPCHLKAGVGTFPGGGV